MSQSRWLFVGVALFSLLSEPARAQDASEQAKLIDKAVVRGLEYLKRVQSDQGTWPRDSVVGPTALAGWTLLECGEPAGSAAVQKAAAAVLEGGSGASSDALAKVTDITRSTVWR